jgi:hypothetical protein
MLIASRSYYQPDRKRESLHRGDGKRFVVRADGKLTAFPELEATCRATTKIPLRNRA